MAAFFAGLTFDEARMSLDYYLNCHKTGIMQAPYLAPASNPRSGSIETWPNDHPGMAAPAVP